MDYKEIREAVKEIERGLQHGVSCCKDGLWKNQESQRILLDLAKSYLQASAEKDQKIKDLMEICKTIKFHIEANGKEKYMAEIYINLCKNIQQAENALQD